MSVTLAHFIMCYKSVNFAGMKNPGEISSETSWVVGCLCFCVVSLGGGKGGGRFSVWVFASCNMITVVSSLSIFLAIFCMLLSKSATFSNKISRFDSCLPSWFSVKVKRDCLYQVRHTSTCMDNSPEDFLMLGLSGLMYHSKSGFGIWLSGRFSVWVFASCNMITVVSSLSILLAIFCMLFSKSATFSNKMLSFDLCLPSLVSVKIKRNCLCQVRHAYTLIYGQFTWRFLDSWA